MVSCSKDSDSNEPGDIEIEFDNIAIVNGVERQLTLATSGSTDYSYTNGKGKILISIFYGITSPTSN